MSFELDLQILSAVQLNPRISWTRLAAILSVDPSTISRRWTRMRDDRTVWTTCLAVPKPVSEHMMYAFVELSCAPGRRQQIIDVLTDEHRIYSVNCTSGSRDLFLIVSAPGLVALDGYIDDRITSISGVTGAKTHFVQSVHLDGPGSRLGFLTDSQAKDVLQTVPVPTRRIPMSESYLDLISALAGDIRRPVSDVQREVGRSVSSVSRGIEALLGVEWARWRVDIAHDHMGWEAEAMLWLRVDHPERDRVIAMVAKQPHVRLCASVVGEANLVGSFWMRDLYELDAIERRLQSTYPGVRVVDRWIIPRVAKRTGHVLDSEGLWSHFVGLQ
ncbi:Lrp/AsnC family transcriptional regulator [Tomitella fengzijianii]|uniref:Lrp/AsnC family transcriptional regulator n=1 Tax=Tomitella fengzijianii TaxID=2597660 RepID=UPI00131C48CB|nr:Lrp/AsnC family transcriptional regulator [Tomitella fengzijianii]